MLYDYKSDKLTQETYITCICSIVDDLIDEYSTLHRYENLSIYTPAYIVREILGRLLDRTDDLWVHTDSDISLIYADGNDLVVTIACDGMIFIESAKNNDVIKSNEDCCLTYFYDGLGQKDLYALEENAESILVFGFEDDDCEGCKSEDNELDIESDGDMHGFCVNHSDDCGNYYYSFYSTDKDLVSEMTRLFRR